MIDPLTEDDITNDGDLDPAEVEQADRIAAELWAVASVLDDNQDLSWTAQARLAIKALDTHRTAAGLTITETPDEWEYVVRYASGAVTSTPHKSLEAAQFIVSECPGSLLYRRRPGGPAGPWERVDV